MNTKRLNQELGRFVILFQEMEDAIKEIIILISDDKEYIAHAFLTKTDFRSSAEIADVIFTHFVNITANTDESYKIQFHALINNCKKIGEDRNNIVHSIYSTLKRVDGETVLIQENPKLKFKGGSHLSLNEKELSLEEFIKYCQNVDEILDEIEKYRLKIIEWMYQK